MAIQHSSTSSHHYYVNGHADNGDEYDGSEDERVNHTGVNGHAGNDTAEEGEHGGHDGEGGDGDGDGDASGTTEAALMRHGFESYDAEVLKDLESKYFLYYSDTRHQSVGRAKPPPYHLPPEWRSKDKVKIVQGALVVCLKIGFDPPDVIKTQPCARLEAWVDTAAIGKERCQEQIASNLGKQFESLALSSKARFQTYMDPAHEDLRKLCVGLRRKARNDRALFYYNGHGVPRPTPSGEIWVFNRQYTQYIPVSVADVVGYLSGPTVYIWDCSNAGNIVNKIKDLQALPEGKFPTFSATTNNTSSNQPTNAQGLPTAPGKDEPDRPVSIAAIQDIIQIAACQAHETLPMNPDLPADLFTSCITSPIEMSVRFFLLHNPLRSDVKPDLAMRIPGKLSDRKTPLGELIWIFTSVTDTIAWNSLPKHLFQRLFRHDLVMAAIFRGFLLAERIMRRYNCTPVSVPALPPCASHPLWDSWDLALDRCLAQMPALVAYEDAKKRAETYGDPPPPPFHYNNSYFFSDHLSAFSVWIDQGTARTVEPAAQYLESGHMLKSGYKRTLPDSFAQLPVQESRPKILTNGYHHTETSDSAAAGQQQVDGAIVVPFVSTIPPTIAALDRTHKTLRVAAEQPEHLPILLQVLLSQVHRLRALMLLCKFFDLGPWAVNLGLSIGIFPYILKLLQAPSPELRPVLIYIWTRILAIYRLCQEDLAKAAGPPSTTLPFHYFASIIDPNQQLLVIPNVSEHRAMCCFIISIFMRDYAYAQQLALINKPPNSTMNVFEACLHHLKDPDPLLRQWAALTIGILWDDFDEAKGIAVRNKAHSDLSARLLDSVPEVRTAALFALGVFVGLSGGDVQAKRGSAGRALSGCAIDRTAMTEQWQVDEELGIVMTTLRIQSDGCPLARKELVILLSAVAYNYRGAFAVAAYDHAKDMADGRRASPQELYEQRLEVMDQSFRLSEASQSAPSTYTMEFRAILFTCMYTCLLDLAADPCPDVSERANLVVDYVHEHLIDSDLPFAVPAPPLSTDSSVDSPASTAGSKRSEKASTSRATTLVDGRSSDHAKSRHSASLLSTFKALSKLGLADAHASRFPGVSSQVSPAAVTRVNATATGLTSSKSMAHFGDFAQSSRQLRNTSSADDLRKAVTDKSARDSSSRSSVHHPDPEKATVTVEEAKDALFEIDAQGQEKSRHTPVAVVVTPSRVAGPVTLSPNPAREPPPLPPYVPNQTITDENGKPTRTEMPLRSEFFDWSCEYFINPQMKEKESDEPGSVEYNERHWRRERNERVLVETQTIKERASFGSWDHQTAELDNITPATILAWHQFEPHLLATDDTGAIRLYDWQQRRLLTRFQSIPRQDERFVKPPKVTSLKFLNDDDTALILIGSADGCVRIYRDYETTKPFLVTAWRALPHMLPTTNDQAGLVAEWQQTRGRLVAAGNSKMIRIWDAQQELCSQEIPTRANSCITSLTSDQVAGDYLVAGFGDGVVRAYDVRLPPKDTMVQCWRGFHGSWIKQVHMQRGGHRELVSASLNGEVCFWDIRASDPIKSFSAHQDGLSGLSVHEHAPVLATGSDSGIVKVWDVNDQEAPVSRFRNSNGGRNTYTRGEPIHPVISMEFHPHMMMLAVCSDNAKINVYNWNSQ